MSNSVAFCCFWFLCDGSVQVVDKKQRSGLFQNSNTGCVVMDDDRETLLEAL